ncbi:serine/threonine-protein kinase [Streptomyces sp. NPDC058662]|uniref:serine/threonine-protein kinase n=1 Tax=Streptomyces sp. NPDC058662 TaxID=3346583 RepID=UPI00365B60B4
MPAPPVPAYGAPPDYDALLGGRYQLRGVIGSGGTADVFRGIDQVLGREVAVKVFRPGADTVTADRFCDEARTLARLSHRALVTVYDAGRHGHGAYMVTELIRGVTLRTRMDAGPLSPVQVTRIGADIASALDHVHAHGIIHHDVKPSNVILGEEGSPYLADFGLSRTVHAHSHSAPDTLVGTLAYMAPEQFLGQGASTASDIYALGVTLLEALTGHREYRGTPVEIGTAHLLHPPRVPEGLPPDLARLLRAMTDQDPQARPDAAAVHLGLLGAAPAPPTRAAAGAAPRDTRTHRTPVPPAAASRTEPAPPPRPGRAAAGRRRAALSGLAAVSVAATCALVVGGTTAGRDAPPSAPVREHSSASKDTQTPPSPPAPAAPDVAQPQPQAATTTAPPLPAPAGPSSSQPGGERPAQAPGTQSTKDTPGKAKGKEKKGKGQG